MNKATAQRLNHECRRSAPATTPSKSSVGGEYASTILYGKSINPVVKDNAQSRRQKRRRAEEVDNGLITSLIDRALGLKPEKQQYPSRWEKLSKRKPAPPLDLSTLTQYQEQITLSAEKHMKARYPHRGAFVEFEAGSCCLENVALFQAGYRNSVNLTAR